MAFDPGNFTLHFVRRAGAPTILDLRTPPPAHASDAALAAAASAPPLYTFERARTAAYDVQLVDGLTQAPLAKLQEPSSAERARTVRLLNPDSAVLLEKDRNTFSQSYSFNWEGETYQMRRESSIGSKYASFTCEVVRKPDPAMAVAMYKPSTKTRPDTLQIFDYNLARLHIEDKRGLEIALLAVLLSLLDMEYDEAHKGAESVYSENYVAPAAQASSSGNAPPAVRHEILPVAGSRPPGAQAEPSSSSSRPLVPGVASGAPLAAAPMLRHSNSAQESNEIDITSYGDIAEYVAHCVHLLRADEGGCEMIILKAASKDTTPRAVRIAAEVKSAWFRLPPHAKGPPPSGPTLDRDAGTLYQYVRDPALEAIGTKPAAAAAPRQRISLNESTSKADSAHAAYAPPEALSIYLSKSRIDELERRDPSTSTPGQSSPWASPPVIPAKVPVGSSPSASTSAPGGGSGATSPRPGSSGATLGMQASVDPKGEPKRGVGKLFGKFARKGAAGGSES